MNLTTHSNSGTKPEIDDRSDYQSISPSTMFSINHKEEIIRKNNERIKALETIVNSILLNS